MTTLAASATFSSSPLWFLTRSTGLIAFAVPDSVNARRAATACPTLALRLTEAADRR
jgi:ferredoxin